MRVYVAGPYTKGDVVLNVRRAIEAGDRLAEAGHTPFVPHLSHFWHLVCPHPWDFWMRQDKAWLVACEAFVRLPGESTGADIERDLAEKMGLPIYDSVDTFLRDHPR